MAKSKPRRLPVYWNNNEYNRLLELLNAISVRSQNLSDRILQKILQNVDLISYSPYLFEKDDLKLENDGSYRKFTCILVRVTYKVESNRVIIVRVRHANSEPLVF